MSVETSFVERLGRRPGAWKFLIDSGVPEEVAKELWSESVTSENGLSEEEARKIVQAVKSRRSIVKKARRLHSYCAQEDGSVPVGRIRPRVQQARNRKLEKWKSDTLAHLSDRKDGTISWEEVYRIVEGLHTVLNEHQSLSTVSFQASQEEPIKAEEEGEDVDERTDAEQLQSLQRQLRSLRGRALELLHSTWNTTSCAETEDAANDVRNQMRLAERSVDAAESHLMRQKEVWEKEKQSLELEKHTVEGLRSEIANLREKIANVDLLSARTQEMKNRSVKVERYRAQLADKSRRINQIQNSLSASAPDTTSDDGIVRLANLDQQFDEDIHSLEEECRQMEERTQTFEERLRELSETISQKVYDTKGRQEMVRKLEANEAEAKKSIEDALQRLEQCECELEKVSQDHEMVEERFRRYEGTAERLMSHVNSEEAELCKLLTDTAIKKSVAEEEKAHVEQLEREKQKRKKAMAQLRNERDWLSREADMLEYREKQLREETFELEDTKCVLLEEMSRERGRLQDSEETCAELQDTMVRAQKEKDLLHEEVQGMNDSLWGMLNRDEGLPGMREAIAKVVARKNLLERGLSTLVEHVSSLEHDESGPQGGYPNAMFSHVRNAIDELLAQNKALQNGARELDEYAACMDTSVTSDSAWSRASSPASSSFQAVETKLSILFNQRRSLENRIIQLNYRDASVQAEFPGIWTDASHHANGRKAEETNSLPRRDTSVQTDPDEGFDCRIDVSIQAGNEGDHYTKCARVLPDLESSSSSAGTEEELFEEQKLRESLQAEVNSLQLHLAKKDSFIAGMGLSVYRGAKEILQELAVLGSWRSESAVEDPPSASSTEDGGNLEAWRIEALLCRCKSRVKELRKVLLILLAVCCASTVANRRLKTGNETAEREVQVTADDYERTSKREPLHQEQYKKNTVSRTHLDRKRTHSSGERGPQAPWLTAFSDGYHKRHCRSDWMDLVMSNYNRWNHEQRKS